MKKIQNENEKIEIQVSSEIGRLEALIMHTPGKEVENMTPENASKALYSDILNLPAAREEYREFRGAVEKHARVFELKDLLTDILQIQEAKQRIIDDIFKYEKVDESRDYLMSTASEDLATMLLEGVVEKKNTLTKFFDDRLYSIRPLHNFFYMRDAAMAVNNSVLIGQMKSEVRDRESRIMAAIFDYHPKFVTDTVKTYNDGFFDPDVSIEGGDLLVVREDILLIGTGPRTTSQGIDFILDYLRQYGPNKHIIVQELPHKPESFIHLDMVFTILDRDRYMMYEPIILEPNKYRTVHIHVINGKVKINTVENIPTILKELGIDMQAIRCGGSDDPRNQDREQWHSGANFFALGPGKVIGYERNEHTIEEMSKHGFEIIKAEDINSGKTDLNDYNKYCITIKGSELSRGGGGARCMTMPIRREKL